MKQKIIILFLLSLLLVPRVFRREPSALEAQNTQNLDWYTQNIDQPDNYRSIDPYSMQVDSTGQAHIVYLHDDGNMYFASHVNNAWQKEVITATSTASRVALAFDTLDTPHIAFVDNGLKYGYHNGSNWVIQTVDGEINSMPSLALDENNMPHISYAFNGEETVDGYPFQVKYAHWTGTNWNTEIIEEGITDRPGIFGGSIVRGTSIALDSTGNPFVSYALGPSNLSLLKYATRTGNQWGSQIIRQLIWDYTSDPYIVSPSIKLDSNDAIHIAYGLENYADFGIYDTEIIYSKQVNGSWQGQSVASGANMEEFSFKVDSQGNPHVSFSTPSTPSYAISYGVFHVYSENGEWVIERIASETGPNSLAIDENDNAHIGYSYKQGVNGEMLMYAGQYQELALNKTAVPQNEISAGETVTYTLTFSGPEHTAILVDPLPDNVKYVPNSVSSSAIYSSTIRSIIWEGPLTAETPQEISFAVTIMADTVQYPAIVNMASLTDKDYEEKSISTVNIVNGWRQYLPLIFKAP